MHRSVLIPVVGVVLALLASSVPAAEVPAGVRGRDVVQLRVVGLPSELQGQVAGGLELTPRRRIVRTVRAPLTSVALARDLDRVRLFLARRGYADAAVEAIDDQPLGGESVGIDAQNLRRLEQAENERHDDSCGNAREQADQ